MTKVLGTLHETKWRASAPESREFGEEDAVANFQHRGDILIGDTSKAAWA